MKVQGGWHTAALFGCKCQIIQIDNPIPNVTAFAECDINKFAGYVFSDKYKDGKKEIFESWGYSILDSKFLQEEFKKQALEKYCKGEYKFKGIGYRCVKIEIIIELRANNGKIQRIKTGWVVESNGLIRLSTPNSGHTY